MLALPSRCCQHTGLDLLKFNETAVTRALALRRIYLNGAIDAILVPQGAEFTTVARACGATVPVVAIPVGAALAAYLPTLPLASWRRVLIMGLCGSLDDRHAIGDVVVYAATVGIDGRQWEGDRELMEILAESIEPAPARVLALTSPQVVFQAAAKQQYRQQYGAEVVDMEGQLAQSLLAERGIAVGTIRVVSDDCHHDLPDLSTAFDDRGRIRSWSLAQALVSNPVAGVRLVRGALRALAVLDRVARQFAIR